MRKHLRGNRGTRWLAILLTAAMVVGSVDATVLAEAAKGAEEQTLPVAEAGTSGDAKDKEETPAVEAETTEEVKDPEAAENAQTGKDANAPETSGNAEKAGADENSTSENGAGGVLSELQEAPLEVELPTETIELESEFSEEWDNDELFEGYAWKQLYGDEGIATYGTVARSHLSEEEKAAYDKLKELITDVARNGGCTRFYFGSDGLLIAYTENSSENNSLKEILDALKTDCPYELYWWNGQAPSSGKTIYVDGKYQIKLTELTLVVAQTYQGESNIYVDATKAKAVDKAVANAKEIVKGLQDKSVYERLNGYKNAIKDLASYNAKLNDSDYVQQLINVFDEDPSTATGYEGYARAFQYLCDLDAGGIKCYTVKGTMQYARHTDSGPFTHQNMTWNIVRLRRKNYLVDVVTCDSNGIAGAIGYEDGKDKLFLAGAKKTDSGNYRKEFNNPNDYVWYSYDGATKKAYTEAELNISSEDYDDSDPLPIENATITIAAGTDIHEDETFTYDAQNHDVVVTLGEDELEPEYDYTLTITKDGAEFSGAIRNAGKYEIIVTGSGGYTGSVKKTVTIEKKPVKLKLEGTATKQYDGNTGAWGMDITIDGQCDGDPLSSHVTSAYDTPDVGENKTVRVSVTLEGKNAGNYDLTESTVSMNNGVITKGDPTLRFRELAGSYATTYTYSGEALRNPVGNELILGNTTTGVQIIDYEDLHFTWYKGTVGSGTKLNSAPVDAGEYYLVVSVNEEANYHAASCSSGQITIKRKPVTDPEITLSPDSFVYDGEEKKPAVTVKAGEVELSAEEYSVSYTNNINAGDQATVTIANAEGGNYEVSGSQTFTITPADISGAIVTVNGSADVIYTGKPVKPAVSVKLGDKTLADTDYSVSYDNNRDLGEASATIIGKGNYKGQATGKFKIALGNYTGPLFYNGNDDGADAYYSNAVSITAGNYGITDTLQGSFERSYTFAGEQEGEVRKVLYFYNLSEGGIYQKEVTVKFDKTAPTGKITIGKKFWESLLKTITFGHYKVNESVTIEGKDALSGVDTIEYLISDKQMTAEELKDSGVSYTAYNENAKPSLENDKNQIVYVKITDKAGNAGYLSSDGIILDTTAPTISDIQIVAGADWTDTQFKFQFTVNEEGTYYYQVLPATETPPDAAAVMAAAIAAKEGENAGTGKTGALTDGRVTTTGTATGLRANTEYKIYVVAQDNVYNISTDAADPNTSEVAIGTATTKKAAPVVEENPTVSGMYGTKVSELKIEGGKITADGVAIAGTWAMAGAESNEPDKILTVGTTETCILTFTPEDSEYPARNVEVTPTITARPVTVAIHPVSREYREKNPEFTYTVATGEGLLGLVGDDDLEIELTTKADANSEVGMYAVTGTASNKNYDVTITGGENALTIEQAELKAVTVSVKDDKKLTYGEKLGTLILQGTFAAKKSGATVEDGTFTIMNGEKQPSAGPAMIEWIFIPADQKNYGQVNGTTNITVEKATPERAAAPTASELTYGQTLADSTLTGGKAVNPNTQEKVAGTWSWADDTVKPTVDNQGYQVVFTPEDTANYNSIEATVGVTVKKAVPTISEAPTASDLTYGQTLSESTLTGGAASTDGTFTWAKADTRPEVTDSNVTEYEVVFTPTDTVNWGNAAAQSKVKVSPKTLTWDGSALTVLTKLADETKDASLIGELKVSGLLDGDDAGLSYESLTAEFDTAEAGTDKQVTVTIAGAALTNANYVLPAETAFTLKGSIEKTADLTGQTGLGNDYRLVMGAKDVTEVTPDLAKTENLNTPEKIVEYLKKLLVDCKIDGRNPAKENTVVYDAVLLYSMDGGETWIRATADNFPAEGVKVLLPYPEGTNAADYRFSAVHMFAMNRGAYKAGDVETPELTLTKNGITMTLKSLSPIALSWVKVEKAPETKPGDHSGSSSGSGNKSGGSKSSGSAVTSAATGDSSQPVFWGAMALICLLGICVLLTAVRRKRGQRTE